jgi:hypothetical protein
MSVKLKFNRASSGHLVAASLLFGVWASPTSAQNATPTQVDRDLAARSSEIHWPQAFTPADADLFAHNEIDVSAPCSVVWSHLVNAAKWPEWYPNSKDVKVVSSSAGILTEGAKFDWQTFGLNVSSRVHEFVVNSRLGWFGDAPGLNAYHTWFLTAGGEKCHVINEEVVKGPGAINLRKSDPDAMHKGHDLWNAVLKQVSEQKP